MIIFPNAKINLGLSVTEKRPDGFHNIETVFYPVPLRDILEIVPAKNKSIQFKSTGLKIPGNQENNLVLKACKALQQDFQLPGMNIHLHKVIPMGAGLGGGSSNAAFAIKLVDKIFELNLSEEQMIKYAMPIGADCSFFIKNKAVFASQKGDVFEDIDLDLLGKYILIVKPNLHINTAEAYSGVTPFPKLISIKELIQNDLSDWNEVLKNDFEKSIFLKHPEIGQIKDSLLDLGAVYAAMSGSGSALFGIFDSEPECSELFKNYFCWKSKL
ncbi:MAG: 4-(cytidine 5'-diphospho)-2-C-methyl-D-erythritol kinase [Bacteroidetes bacterium]|nr:4-(cytidine 5'-diphospho)-2-C-methyl-D-erythritol kinase [Bacteroidota bacterium]|tara:strand:+ start:123 stop:935 length:813 start_codon:yes stop_codon:yes gene_type:complete